MIKRASALFIILLANIILFAHAVIPHYHHKTEVCIESFHGQINHDDHEDKTNDDKHEHNGENSSDYCASKQVFVIPGNQVKQEYKCLDNTDNDLQLNKLQTIGNDKDLCCHFQAILSENQLLFYTSTYSCFASTILGLRAPPVV